MKNFVFLSFFWEKYDFLGENMIFIHFPEKIVISHNFPEKTEIFFTVLFKKISNGKLGFTPLFLGKLGFSSIFRLKNFSPEKGDSQQFSTDLLLYSIKQWKTELF